MFLPWAGIDKEKVDLSPTMGLAASGRTRHGSASQVQKQRSTGSFKRPSIKKIVWDLQHSRVSPPLDLWLTLCCILCGFSSLLLKPPFTVICRFSWNGLTKSARIKIIWTPVFKPATVWHRMRESPMFFCLFVLNRTLTCFYIFDEITDIA